MENYLTGFEVTRVQGGMEEFENTGIYPDYLLFNSAFYQHNWKEQCSSDKQEGSLFIDGHIVYNYKLTDIGCSVQAFHHGAPVSEWLQVPMAVLMID